MKYIARRNFWGEPDGQPRRMIKRGETFITTDFHGQQLLKRNLAIVAPEEPTAAPGPANVQTLGPSNKQTAAPQETKIEPVITNLLKEAANNSEALNNSEPEPAAEIPNSSEIPSSPEPLPDDHKELKALAKAAGIKGYNTMKKETIKQKLLEKGSFKNG